MDLTAITLIASNAVPLFGVVLGGWDLQTVLLAFWAETAVIGSYAIVKMLSARGGPASARRVPWFARLLLVPFFCVHFGLFMAVHGVFLVGLASGGNWTSPAGNSIWTAAPMIVLDSSEIRWFVVATTISHGISTIRHHFRDGERDRHGPLHFMMQPYARVMVQHLAVLFGAFATVLFGSGTGVLLLLVALKTGLDLRQHTRSHAART